MYTGVRVFAKLLDLAGEAVRDLLVELLERGLAHQLGDEEAERLGADSSSRIEEGALGERALERREQLVHAFAGEGGDECALRASLRASASRARRPKQIDLVEHGDDGRARRRRRARAASTSDGGGPRSRRRGR